MKATKSQQDRIRSEIQRSIIISAILTFVFGSYLFRVSLRLGTTLVTVLFFFLLSLAYLLQVNHYTAKAMRPVLSTERSKVFGFSLVLWLVILFYSLFVSHLSASRIAAGLLYCLIPTFLVYQFPPKNGNLAWTGWLALILLWLPVELHFFKQPEIPPGEGVISIFSFVAIILTLFLFHLVHEISDIGLTFRWVYQDVERAVWYFLLFVAVVGIPVGFIGRLFSLVRYFPGTEKIIATIFFIYFFIALPEELLFRGIVQNRLTQKFARLKNGVILSVGIASILFALAHIFMIHIPFLRGNAVLLAKPMVYFILSAGAGVFYGLTYLKTRKVTIAALTHALVDIPIFLFLCG